MATNKKRVWSENIGHAITLYLMFTIVALVLFWFARRDLTDFKNFSAVPVTNTTCQVIRSGTYEYSGYRGIKYTGHYFDVRYTVNSTEVVVELKYDTTIDTDTEYLVARRNESFACYYHQSKSKPILHYPSLEDLHRSGLNYVIAGSVYQIIITIGLVVVILLKPKEPNQPEVIEMQKN